MDPLKLIHTDDHVAQGSAVLQDEDRAVAAGVGIGVTGSAAVELLVAHVFGAGDDAGRGEGHDGADAAGDVEGLACGEAYRCAEDGDFEAHVCEEMIWKLIVLRYTEELVDLAVNLSKSSLHLLYASCVNLSSLTSSLRGSERSR